MAPEPQRVAGLNVDLSSRIVLSTAVVASPTANAETIIGQITIPANAVISTGIILNGWAAYTVGTSGTSGRLRIRQTGTSGATVADTGVIATGHTAGLLVADDVNGVDTAGTLPGQVYVLTLLIAAGAATSTVSAVYLVATIV
jgi:hypothetical protein